jgi:hypothetical protein
MRFCFFLLLALCGIAPLQAQTGKDALSYYLPDIEYDPAVPSPNTFLGYRVGFDWHVSHDQLVFYMRELARTSKRIQLQEYGRSHENRPLMVLTITHPDNFPRLETIKRQRQALADNKQENQPDLKDMPAVIYQGYSIHGNEASGSNAALLYAYYLAAARSEALDKQLRNVVILLDPCFNPDGLQRFSSWVNSRRSKNLVSDPMADEYHESWPGGRTNHYWFDLNRDWLVTQQPESPGRVAIFQDWLPNVLTDHHEMGANSTFFFQPGVPSRVNPITPAQNQELTARIGKYHADILSEKDILFFSRENYDDFYYGKGSTYPDANGCIGILFEQAGSRGIAQETTNGRLDFSYTVRNQVLTSFSTLKAAAELRQDLNTYLRDFFKTALEEAKKDPVQAYVFSTDGGDEPGREFLRILLRHKIQVYRLGENTRIGDADFSKEDTYVVPVAQSRYRLIRGVFERPTEFQDSIFYDISAWTLPDAFGLAWATADGKALQSGKLGAAVQSVPGLPAFTLSAAQDAYAFILPAEGFYLPKVANRLLEAGLRVKVATKPFAIAGRTFERGALMIPVEKQVLDLMGLYNLMQESTKETGVEVVPVLSGQSAEGPDLGSSNFTTLKRTRVAVITGSGMTTSDVGEVWHYLDTQLGMAPVLIDAGRLNNVDLSAYEVVVLADGSPSGSGAAEQFKAFVSEGGTLIATGSALRWLSARGLMDIRFRNAPPFPEPGKRRAYEYLGDDRAARRLPGAIFEAELDLSHPLCYGYRRSTLPVFLGDTIYVETARNPYATPAVLSKSPLLAGYLHDSQRPLAAGSAVVLVGGTGRGKIICFAGDPVFRAFWYGANRLLANAIFFSGVIDGAGVEK